MVQQCSLDVTLSEMLVIAAEIAGELYSGMRGGFPEEKKHRIQQLYDRGVSLHKSSFDYLIDNYCEKTGVSREFLGLAPSEE